MKKENKKELFRFLKERISDLEEDPCSNCNYYECEKFSYNDLLKKKYKEFNIIDWKSCLKERKKELEKYKEIMRDPFWKKISFQECRMCKKKFHYLDMHIKLEIKNKIKSLLYPLELFELCDKCNQKYKRIKTPLMGDGWTKR